MLEDWDIFDRDILVNTSIITDTKLAREYMKEFFDKYENTDTDLYSKGIDDNPMFWFKIYDDEKCEENSLSLFPRYPRKRPRIGNKFQAVIPDLSAQ